MDQIKSLYSTLATAWTFNILTCPRLVPICLIHMSSSHHKHRHIVNTPLLHILTLTLTPTPTTKTWSSPSHNNIQCTCHIKEDIIQGQAMNRQTTDKHQQVAMCSTIPLPTLLRHPLPNNPSIFKRERERTQIFHTMSLNSFHDDGSSLSPWN